MKVSEILFVKGSSVHTVSPGASLRSAVERMATVGVGSLVVVDADGAIAGMVSERDVIRALAGSGDAVLARAVADVMTHDVITCSNADRLGDLMHIMTKHRVRHLPVVERDRLVGLVSIGDLVKARLEELEVESHVMRDAYLRVR
ncbi:MAG: CBS domain-containing protein [Ilumatobacteraceae bacterium]